MLVLSRQSGQTVRIGDTIFLTVGWIGGDSVCLNVYGPAALLESLSGDILNRRANAATLELARGEALKLGTEIAVTVVDIRTDKVRLGIDSPWQLPVHRKEVFNAIRRENDAAGG